MNNLSALNQVFVSLNQNVASLNQKFTYLKNEIEGLKHSMKELVTDKEDGCDEHVNQVSYADFYMLKQEFDNLQTNLIKKDDIQLMIDNAIRELVNVLTSSSQDTSSTIQESSVNIIENTIENTIETPLEVSIQNPIDNTLESSIETTPTDFSVSIDTEKKKTRGKKSKK